MKPLRTDDFRPLGELSQAFFRATNPHVDGPAFAKKWAKAMDSPLRFLRSFPQAWYVDLLDVPGAHLPGAQTICFGDPHVENFGIITFKEGPRFVFNDLDDAGPGLAGVDALRYFTSLELAGFDDLVEAMTGLYEGIITDRDSPREFPEALHPDVAARDQKELTKWFRDGEFKYGDKKRDLERVPQDEAQALLAVLEREAAVDHLEVVSLARRNRAGGGSGGLARYLVQARDHDSGEVALLEFKEATHAATSWARSLHEEDHRLTTVQASLWPDLTPRCMREVIIGRTVYLLRHRLGRGKIKLDKLDEDEQRAVIAAQVSILACRHRAAFCESEASRLRKWLSASVEVMAKRYRRLFEDFEDQHRDR